jgi:AbrB family transcriptional regulator (stage V sporulation protein T)
MENRKTSMESGSGQYELIKDLTETYGSYVIAPIISSGDPIGSVILVSKDTNVQMGQMEMKMAETAAGFLAKQMEQ